MTGGEAVVRSLKAAGVDTVFGIVSVHMLPIYDALSREPSIQLIVPRHEQGAAFMADGYARTTGRPGVYCTSTGPGAFNSACAVHEAWVASSPTIQITGNIE
ncbi:MAG: thiamine pyrophosphate-binding protein, partial [Dehalococcoidia bacterium]